MNIFANIRGKNCKHRIFYQHPRYKRIPCTQNTATNKLRRKFVWISLRNSQLWLEVLPQWPIAMPTWSALWRLACTSNRQNRAAVRCHWVPWGNVAAANFWTEFEVECWQVTKCETIKSCHVLSLGSLLGSLLRRLCMLVSRVCSRVMFSHVVYYILYSHVLQHSTSLALRGAL